MKFLRLLLLTGLGASIVAAQGLGTVQITRTPSGSAVPSDFMGLSIQQDYALTFFGPSTNPNSVLFTLIRNLGSGGSLRIGGNAADYSCWGGQPAPDPSICQYTTTSADFNSWSNASSQTGWPMLVGVSLAQDAAAGAPQYILDEVALGLLPAVKRFPGASLSGLELGNEINLYFLNPAYRPSTYNVTDQAADLLSYISVLKANGSTKSIPLAAPAYFDPTVNSVTGQLDPLMTDVLQCAGCSSTNLSLVTLHEYPLSVAKGPVTISQLLSPAVINAVEKNFTKAVGDMSSLFKLNVQLGETNSTEPDPGQSGVSNVQASALWALDYALDMARIGVRRINFHTHDGSFYDPIQTTVSGTAYTNQVQPEYYGLYAFNLAKGLKFLPVTTTVTANVRVYALAECGRCAITVFLINKDTSAAGTVQISLSTPATSATYFELSAPSLSSSAQNISYGGAQFNNATGILTGPVQTIPVQPGNTGVYTITLDSAAAGILTIQP